jgi:hypothetical protein
VAAATGNMSFKCAKIGGVLMIIKDNYGNRVGYIEGNDIKNTSGSKGGGARNLVVGFAFLTLL